MARNTRLLRWFSLIRTRLTLWIMSILAVGLLTFTIITLLIAQQLLITLNENRLQQSVRSLSVALAQEPGLSSTQVELQLNASSTSEIFLQYQSKQGKLIASSTNLGRTICPGSLNASTVLKMLAANQKWDLASRLLWVLLSSTAGRSGWRVRLGREAVLLFRFRCSTSRTLLIQIV